MKTTTMDTKNSTSKISRDIYMLCKEAYTDGPMWKYERHCDLYKYHPETSSFSFFRSYTRLRDAYRAMFRKGNDFRLVYLR